MSEYPPKKILLFLARLIVGISFFSEYRVQTVGGYLLLIILMDYLTHRTPGKSILFIKNGLKKHLAFFATLVLSLLTNHWWSYLLLLLGVIADHYRARSTGKSAQTIAEESGESPFKSIIPWLNSTEKITFNKWRSNPIFIKNTFSMALVVVVYGLAFTLLCYFKNNPLYRLDGLIFHPDIKSLPWVTFYSIVIMFVITYWKFISAQARPAANDEESQNEQSEESSSHSKSMNDGIKKVSLLKLFLIFGIPFTILNAEEIFILVLTNHGVNEELAAKLRPLPNNGKGHLATNLTHNEYLLLMDHYNLPYPSVLLPESSSDISYDLKMIDSSHPLELKLNYQVADSIIIDTMNYCFNGFSYRQTISKLGQQQMVSFVYRRKTPNERDFEPSANEVMIFHKVFMRYNLDVECFRNGDSIFHAETPEMWENAAISRIPAWCYPKDTLNGKYTGKLYNAYAVMDPRGLAPEGWRLPNEDDMAFVINFSTFNVEGNDPYKYFRNASLWRLPGRNAVCRDCGRSSYFFQGLPVNLRYATGNWHTYAYQEGRSAAWWCALQPNQTRPHGLYLPDAGGHQAFISDTLDPGAGLSVRCMR